MEEKEVNGGVSFIVGFLLGTIVTLAFFVTVTLKLERSVDQLSRDINRFRGRLSESFEHPHSGEK